MCPLALSEGAEHTRALRNREGQTARARSQSNNPGCRVRLRRMTAPGTDRRVQRTHELLLDAMLGLMIERGYERFTIQHLIDRAGVGRATFYAHFDSKEDLLVASIGRLKASLLAAPPAAAGAATKAPAGLGFSLPFFLHVHSHRRIYDAIVGRRSQALVEAHIARMLDELVREDFAQRGTPGLATPAERDAAVAFIVGALWACTKWWLESRAPMDGHAIDALFQRMCRHGLDGVIRPQA
jgi:AcrR family transcriptional regulator